MRTSFITALAVATGLTSAAPLTARQDSSCPVVQSGDYVWKISELRKISELSARKLDGKSISSLSFNIKATNSGTLDFTCSSSNTIEEGKFYECGENSQIYFGWQDDRSGLILRQDVSDDIQYVATTTAPTYCHAGGSGPNDFVCSGVSDAYITLVQYPGKLPEA